MKLQVITPVGPGHEDLAGRASDSVGIAMEYSMGPFKEVRCLAVNDAKGEFGRSAARNKAVEAADADWLFFLDADDLMHPECLTGFLGRHEAGLDAVFGLTTELVDGNIVTRYQVPTITDYKTLIRHNPFLTIKMGHFVRAEVAKELPFNVDMDCGEDWEYYLRLWRRFKCAKVNSPFFVKVRGSHSTGPRSATGRDWNIAVDKLLEEARLE